MKNIHTVPHDVTMRLQARRPFLWVNSGFKNDSKAGESLPFQLSDVLEAEQTWEYLAPLLASVFPDLEGTSGKIESDLVRVSKLQEVLGQSAPSFGTYYVKADHRLPVAGSIKARGGIYEVFCHALNLAETANIWRRDKGVTTLLDEECKEFFSGHTIAVGSTGNLGLSVGIAARALGFKAVVHMSADAKPWKVSRLIDAGAEVVRHQSDYTHAVAEARAVASGDASTYFVDDEESPLLFLGYSVAALRLKKQLKEAGIAVDDHHPLFLYLPCGIGGAPGGVTFGAKCLFGENVHCFFVEPVESPCALVQMSSNSTEPVSVYDVGLTNQTEADGMAVGQVSLFVTSIVKTLLSGVLTVRDDDLYRWLYLALENENLRLEPSAASGFAGPELLINTDEGQNYIRQHQLEERLEAATHVIWTTGGELIPDKQFEAFVEKGAALNQASPSRKQAN